MKLFLTLMAGDTVVDAKPIFASSSPSLIDAVVGRLSLMVDDAERAQRERSDGTHEVTAVRRSDKAAEA